MYGWSNAQYGAPIRPAFDGVTPYSDPFADIASSTMPTSVPAMLRMAEYICFKDLTLRAAFEQMAAYFLTNLTVSGDLGQDEKEAQKDYLVKQARVMDFTHQSSLNLLIYGNDFTSVFMPFTRYLVCPCKVSAKRTCGLELALKEVQEHPDKYRYRWAGGFFARCPACGYEGNFGKPKDEPDESRPLILRHWNPHDIRIVYNEATGQSAAYDWVIPSDVRTDIRMGFNQHVLRDTPWDWIQAVLNDQNVRFEPDMVHHWFEPHVAGLRVRGWGIPRVFVNYGQSFYNQNLRKMNEVLALGHIVPTRVISPANTAGRGDEGDILKTAYMGDLRSRVNQIIANHKADPTSIHFSPIPLQLQSLGADARQLIPADILNQGMETQLNGCGVPVEFYKSSLGTQNAPVGLRLMARRWAPFTAGQNLLLNFIGKKAQLLLKWEEADYAFDDVNIVDAIELQQLKVQMATAGLLSRTNAMRTVDADFKTEVRQKLEDQRTEMIEQAKYQKEMDAFGFAQQLGNAQALPGQGAPGQPGQPAGGGQPGAAPGGQQGGSADPSLQAPGVPPGSDPLAGIIPQPGMKIDPGELLARAQAAANAMAGMSDSERFTKLREIREANPDFHPMVRAQLDKIRSKARSQGQKLVMQQQYGGGG